MEKLGKLLKQGDQVTADLSVGDICEVWLSLARLYFLQESFVRAKRCVIKGLRAVAENETALSYLFELLLWEGRGVEFRGTYRDMCITSYMEADLAAVAVQQMEKDLQGTAADLNVYRKMLEVARSQRIEVDKAHIYFQMGRCSIENGRLDDAKHFFLEAMECSDDPKSVVVKFREIPDIDKIFSRREILARLQQLGAGGRA